MQNELGMGDYAQLDGNFSPIYTGKMALSHHLVRTVSGVFW
jgi:hypothetical protein